MIYYSFSPNWYRPQCLVFEVQLNRFYYSSNCIIYQYDLGQRRILCQLNLKNYLFKQQGYSISQLFKQQQIKSPLQIKNSLAQQKQKNSKQKNLKQKQKQKQKMLKISALELVQNKQGNFLIVGFNCINLICVIGVQKQSNNFHMSVKKVIDIKGFDGTQFIYLFHKYSNDQSKQVPSQSTKIIVFSPEGVKVTIDLIVAHKQLQQQLIDLKVVQIQRIQQQKSKKIKSLQIKHISPQNIVSNNVNVADDQSIGSQQFHAVFLGTRISTFNGSFNKSCNVIIYNSSFQKIIQCCSLEQIFRPSKSHIESKQDMQKSNLISKKQQSLSILSADSIKVQDESHMNKYVVLSRKQLDKSTIFCQKLQILWFTSSTVKCLVRNNCKKQPSNEQQQQSFNDKSKQDQKNKLSTDAFRVPIQIVYPKKCHHKLVQQQKSTLSIKLVNSGLIVVTGRLGQMILVNIDQIQFKLLKQGNNNFNLSIRPYSYQQDQSPYWLIQPNQKHYRDVYAIYRVYKCTGLKPQAIDGVKTGDKRPSQRSLYLIGTDHTLTSWKAPNSQRKFSSDMLTYESSIKFLTSSVQQIVLSELEPSLIFLRLKDSNIRSCQPLSKHGYWLNQFWKHTNNSYSKEIQKLVMHPTEVGVAAIVSKDGKIVLYDLYQERLIKVLQVKQKLSSKVTSVSQNYTRSSNIKQQSKSKQHALNQQSTRNNTIMTDDSKGKNELSHNKNDTRLRSIQINSISFEHRSIQKSIKSLYSLECESTQNISLFLDKQSFSFSSQTFYQRQLDPSIILMIQSNQFIIIFDGLQLQKCQKKFTVYKKIFKLERIYKTKYWDGQVLIGTKKRKGNLVLQISINTRSSQDRDNNQNAILKSIQKEIALSLGSSSRYIFKLSPCSRSRGKDHTQRTDNEQQMEGNEKAIKVQEKGYILTVILYKGIKFSISLYRIESYVDKQANLTINLLPLFESEQIQISNLSSTLKLNSSSINIQQMIISQQANQYLIGIYNNQQQMVSVVDFSTLIDGVSSRQSLSCSGGFMTWDWEFRAQSKKWAGKQQQTQKGLLQQKDVRMQQDPVCPKRTHQEPDPPQCPQKAKIVQNQTLSQKALITVYQYNNLSYRIESILFNKLRKQQQKTNSTNSQINALKQLDKSHLIILGKDQSVRLLQLELDGCDENHLNYNVLQQQMQVNNDLKESQEVANKTHIVKGNLYHLYKKKITIFQKKTKQIEQFNQIQ